MPDDAARPGPPAGRRGPADRRRGRADPRCPRRARRAGRRGRRSRASRRGRSARRHDRDPAKALRVEVTEAGRAVINLRIPLSLGRAAITQVPGHLGGDLGPHPRGDRGRDQGPDRRDRRRRRRRPDLARMNARRRRAAEPRVRAGCRCWPRSPAATSAWSGSARACRCSATGSSSSRVSALVLGMTGSGLALGTILLAAAIPRGVFMLLGGVLADRISPRDLALASNVLRAAVTTVVAGLVLGDRIEIWHLAAASVVFGTVDAVFLPAINTLVPRLVHADRLAAANARHAGHRPAGRARSGRPSPASPSRLVGVAVRRSPSTPPRSRSPPSRCGSCGPARPCPRRRNRTPGADAGAMPRPRPVAAPAPDARPPTQRPASRHRSRRAGRGRAVDARRPGHALDRHPVDGDQPRLQRPARRSACRGSSSSTSARTPSRWACCSPPSVPARWSASLRRPARCRGRARFGSIVLGADPGDGRRAGGRSASPERRPRWRDPARRSARSTATSTSWSSPGSRAGRTRRCSAGR